MSYVCGQFRMFITTRISTNEENSDDLLLWDMSGVVTHPLSTVSGGVESQSRVRYCVCNLGSLLKLQLRTITRNPSWAAEALPNMLEQSSFKAPVVLDVTAQSQLAGSTVIFICFGSMLINEVQVIRWSIGGRMLAYYALTRVNLPICMRHLD